MQTELINAEKKQVSLEDGSLYFYTIKPVEIQNSLGAIIAVLDEYFITNFADETYKFIRQKSGIGIIFW